MLQNASIAVRLPAADLERARAFYRDKLGLEPAEERPGAYLYRCGNDEFAVYASGGQARGEFTQMGFYVEGNYPSKGSGERAAWFRDSENNLLGVGQIIS